MARRRSRDSEALDSPDLTPVAMAAVDAEVAGFPSAVEKLPKLDPPEGGGKAEKPLDKPIPIFVRDPQGGLRPGQIVRLERWAERMPPGGRLGGLRVRTRGVAETVYVVRMQVSPNITDETPQPECSFSACELVLPEQALAGFVPPANPPTE